MPDGTTLAADLHLPGPDSLHRSSGRFPAIIEYTPYHKINNRSYGPRATRYPYFASHGYVFVNVDIRGTGDSEGWNESFSSPEEIADNLEVIRWCARQPWCDGTVGMIGISYTAGVCYDAARQAPDELKAIVVCQMCSDWYQGMACPGGTPRLFGYENYAPLMAAYNFAPPDPQALGDRWLEVWQQRLDRSTPWSLAQIEHLLDGPFWESRLLRGHEDRVKAATFLIGGWCDWYPDDLLNVFSRLRCPKRVLIGPWTHNYPENAWPLPRINDRYECLRWFDKHLKGIDTDPQYPLEREPPVTLFVREFTPPAPLRHTDHGVFRHESEWPPRVRLQTMYLDNCARHLGDSVGHRDGGQLAAETPSAETTHDLEYRPDVGLAAGRYVIGQMLPGWGMPDDQRLDEPFSLVFTADPVPTAGMPELAGPPEARLFVSCSAEVAFLSIKLCDVAPDGASVMVTKGLLNLTHRKGHERPEPLAPGKVYEVRVPLLMQAYRWLPGHRMRLLIAAADFQNAWPTPQPHTLTLHSGPRRPSQIVLPLADRASPTKEGAGGELPVPRFLHSDFPPDPPEQLNLPQYGIDRDLIGGRISVYYTTRSGIGVDHSRYSVNLLQPADAIVESDYEYPLERPGVKVLVRAACTTRSDDKEFRHEVRVTVTLNGRPYWEKTWLTSAPREGC